MLGQLVQRGCELSIELLEVGVGGAGIGNDRIRVNGASRLSSNALWPEEEV